MRRHGFTLVELLVVVAIIGLLAAILIPTLNGARVAALRTRTQVQFAQWASALESFRGEYGYYPALHASGLVNGGASTDPAGDHLFHDLLAGRRRDGSELNSPAPAAVQNPRRLRLFSFSAADLAAADAPAPFLLQDAFGNVSIAVVVDRNLDGLITAADAGGTFPAVLTRAGESIRPSVAELPTTGLRANVIFYGADPQASAAAPRFICSWR